MKTKFALKKFVSNKISQKQNLFKTNLFKKISFHTNKLCLNENKFVTKLHNHKVTMSQNQKVKKSQSYKITIHKVTKL